MTRARLALVALSAAAVAARGLLARRAPSVSGADPSTEGGSDRGGPTAERESGPPDTPPPKVPWLAAHAEGFLGGLLLLTLVAAAALVVAERLERLPPALTDMPLATTLAALTLGGVYLMWKVPQWQAAGQVVRADLDERERFEIENAARGTLGQILSGVAVVTGLLFAWQQLGNTNENLKVSQEGQITDRFSRAVEQLGSDDPTVRIGAIYALERIAADSERDRRPAMEVLTAFVRERVPRGAEAVPAATPALIPQRPTTEVQAALGVIGRREVGPEEAEQCLDLRATNLRGANLADADLTNVCLDRANLAEATLIRADLTGAFLPLANFSDALASDANFDAADLT